MIQDPYMFSGEAVQVWVWENIFPQALIGPPQSIGTAYLSIPPIPDNYRRYIQLSCVAESSLRSPCGRLIPLWHP